MIIILNETQLFSSIASNKHKDIYDDLKGFINDVRNEQGLTNAIIRKYRSEKITGTKEIFKFRLSNGYRCLFKYNQENRIFPLEQEIFLLEIAEHDKQGEAARRLEGISTHEEDVRIINTDNTDEHLDSFSDNHIKYHRYIPIHNTLDTETLMRKMSEADNRFLYPLQGNQNRVLDETGPLLLMGSAGSGKTLVEITKALQNAHNSYRQLYITFTPMLKDTAEYLYNRYASMPGLEGETEFYAMSRFMLETSDLKDEQYFSFERFLQWMKDNNYIYKYDFLKEVGPIDLWTEIRGIIKGYVNNYFRMLEIKDLDTYIKKEFIKEWVAQGYVAKIKGSNSKYQITKIENLYPIIKNKVPKLYNYLVMRDLEEPFIDEYSYLYGMSDKYSIYDEETKKKIYDFVKTIYQPYLEENKYYDDNDLARLQRQKNNKDEILPYDYVFIDEIQDLSELQILAFLEIADDAQNVYMTGDVSQIINPTLFVKGRVGAIYRQRFENVKLNADHVLNQNFRNGQRILDIVISLLDIRQERLGTYSDDIREVSRAEELKASTPFWINAKKENFLPTISSWLGVPNVAVIVTDTMAKKRLKSELGISQTEETNIFTVQEVKGREFYKTILYNITGDYKDVWQTIMEGPKTRDKSIVTKYMYYFNLLYVAMTRAKYNVFVYEDNETAIVNAIHHLFENLDQNINTIMNITDYDTLENRRIQADTYFEEGDYERAKTYYWQLDDTTNAEIAQAYANIQKGQYEKGILMLYPHADHHEYALEYTGKLTLLNLLLEFKVHGKVNLKKDKYESIMALLDSYEGEEIYPRLLNDTINLMTTLHKKQIITKIETIKKEG